MADPRGFLQHERALPEPRDVDERLRDYREIERPLPVVQAQEQGARCMGCGIPFCHSGCPLGNLIPDFNDMVRRDRWRSAIRLLHTTNNFPEFTGRVCPAPCESACVLAIEGAPVTIERLEMEIADRAWAEGWIEPEPATRSSGKTVGVIGSGPAGLACAQQLSRAGHAVTVYERDEVIGGLLRLGIPDFKLEKRHVARRVAQMEAEGVVFRTSVEVGRDVSLEELKREHDALVIAVGATRPRELPIEGRELAGVHLAMDYLPQQNRAVAGGPRPTIHAQGKRVVVLGGGDTGSDCVGTAHRQGAASVLSIELMPRPPEARAESTPWPRWPMMLRTSSSHAEGGEREWAILTKRFVGDGGALRALEVVRVEWTTDADGIRTMREVEGSEQRIEADLCLLALGFVGPEAQVPDALGVARDARGNVAATDADWVSDVEGVFVCGDARRGQSLVVWAIWEGREAARAVDIFLTGDSDLPTTAPDDATLP